MEENQQVGDLRISGSGSANGGRYNVVSISGSGKIYGDVSCEKFNISGSGKVDGAVTTGSFNISGSGKVVGDLNCIQGGISGSGSILGSINANIVKLMGAINVGHGIEGESIIIKGAVKTLGMVNGDDINIELNGGCEIEEIGATKIKVLRGYGGIIGRFICNIFSKSYGYLTTRTIEADDIYLENTIADVVRGGKVIIGEGCKIKRIEYSESLEIRSAESIIEEEFKL